MDNKIKTTTLTKISGAICLIMAVFATYVFIKFQNYKYFIIEKSINFVILFEVFYILSYVAISLLLFLNKKKPGIIIIIAIHVLINLFYVFRVFSAYTILFFIQSLFMLILLYLSYINLSLYKSKILKVIWFLPFVIGVLRFILTLSKFSNNIQSLDFIFYIPRLLDLAFTFSLGLLAYKDGIGKYSSSENKDGMAHLRERNLAKSLESNLGGADQIKMYKELLDIGAITNEEFQERKKRILKI